MLTADVRRLRETFEAWCRGQPYPSIEQWMQFGRDLRALEFKAACHDLGVDLTVIDVAAELERPGSNVVVLQPRRVVQPRYDGGGA